MTTRRVVLASLCALGGMSCDGGEEATETAGRTGALALAESVREANELAPEESARAPKEFAREELTRAGNELAPVEPSAATADVGALGALGALGPAFLSSWSASGAFTDGDAAIGARFGRTVSVFGDWAVATRQAPTASDLGTTQAFRRTSTGWSRAFTFVTPVDRFPVAVVGSNWLAIGEPCGTPSAACHGRVKLFMRTSTDRVV